MSDSVYDALSRFKLKHYTEDRKQADAVLIVSAVNPELISPGHALSLNENTTNVNLGGPGLVNPWDGFNQGVNNFIRSMAVQASMPQYKPG